MSHSLAGFPVAQPDCQVNICDGWCRRGSIHAGNKEERSESGKEEKVHRSEKVGAFQLAR